MSVKNHSNVICTVCGCCCDNLEVEVKGNDITKVKKNCAMSLSKFMNFNKERNLYPMIRNRNKLSEASFNDAIDRSASILSKAKYPILYGWSLTSCEATEIGVELADYLGGVMDNTTGTCHGPGILGIQDVGESTCTLGQIRNRADLIIYWGSNPVHAHPLHMVRYSAMSKGKYRKGRKDRKVIVVDVRKTDTAKIADHFLIIKQGEDYELLSALTSAVKDNEFEHREVSGVPVERIEEIADMMVNCDFGIIFFGLGLTMSVGKHRNIDMALSLVRELNKRTKFLIMPMRGHFNVTGANHVTAWQTGFPYAVDLSKGYPEYNPGETSAVDILLRDECDASLVVASDPISNFPTQAARNMVKNPLISIDPHQTPTTLCSDVVIPSAHVGLETGGSVYRMDGVVLDAKKVVNPPKDIRTDVEILNAILKQVKRMKG
ncbi:MAG: formylmethanofuran dehydrogenase subunit B [Candidatus Bathyarchaeota archaeon]|nr:formylmethanofuran dehydrogenase subunit B [Candidatus Bathyarchaeota archaeon]